MNNLILVRLLESYFRRPFLSLMPLFALIALGVFSFQRSTPEYISFAGIVVRNDIVSNEMTIQQLDRGFWDTIADASTAEANEMLSSDTLVEQILTRTSMADLVTDPTLNRDDVHDIVRNNVWVEAVADRRFVIFGRADNPETARELSEAAHATFIEWSNRQALLNAEANVVFFINEDAKISAELLLAQDEERDFRIAVPAPVRGERPEAERLTLSEFSDNVEAATERFQESQRNLTTARQILQLTLTEEFQPYLLVDAPTNALKPTKSIQEELLGIVYAALIGLIGSFLFVTAHAISNRSCMYPQDIRNGLGVELLAVLPDDKAHRKRINYMPSPSKSWRPIAHKPLPIPQAKDDLPTMVIPRIAEPM